VCDLASADDPFPRRQILWAQWGLADRLVADPSVWLCHQCNDCSIRCPRDARPGDVMQAIRGLVIERVGAPAFMARLVGAARTTWPLLVGLPIVLWIALVFAVNAFQTRTPLIYGDLVPHWLIYLVFFPAFGLAALAAALGARRVWAAWGEGVERRGSLGSALVGVAVEVLVHRRFRRCESERRRTSGHLALLTGFLGAAATSGLVVVAMYGFGEEVPLPQVHVFKILGNASAVALLVGVGVLLYHRFGGARRGVPQAYDVFFLGLVAGLTVTGIGAEVGRYFFPPWLAVLTYLCHLGMVLSLFLTFPYSKFAHALYRTLAMAHERLVVPEKAP
jgi:quinone-modifying oxidoreductase subunit QmoC